MSAQPAHEPESPTSAEEVDRFPPHLTPVPDHPAEDGEPEGAAPRFVESWRDRLRDLVHPPDILTQGRPSLAEVVRYLWRTEQIPPSGPARVLSRVYCGIATPIIVAAYYAAWISERPARATVFATLLMLTAVWPVGRMLLTALLAPVYWVITTVTNF